MQRLLVIDHRWDVLRLQMGLQPVPPWRADGELCPGRTFAFGDHRHSDMAFQPFDVTLGDLLPGLDLVFQYCQLLDQDRSLDRVKPEFRPTLTLSYWVWPFPWKAVDRRRSVNSASFVNIAPPSP